MPGRHKPNIIKEKIHQIKTNFDGFKDQYSDVKEILDIADDRWTEIEEDRLLELVQKYENDMHKVAQQMPKRNF